MLPGLFKIEDWSRFIIRPEHVPTSDIQKIKTLIKRAKEIKHPLLFSMEMSANFRDMIFFTQEYFSIEKPERRDA